MRLRGKVALVTGGTAGIGAGIGAGIVATFAGEGASVAFTGRTKSTGTALEKTLRERGATATYIQADGKSEADVAAAVATAADAYGPIPQMRAAGGGSIVNISASSSVRSIRSRPAYQASKGAINSSASRPTSRPPPCTSPPMSPSTSPARCSRSTAAPPVTSRSCRGPCCPDGHSSTRF
jgi:NAD(P)-dependent dehydrogenase (short-subunit alcohol dehydrogenase family)